jgi:threonine aldolase
MGNLVGILAHCQRGDEMIVGNKAHTFLYEAGGVSALGGVHSLQLPNQSDGSLRLEDLAAAIRPDDPHDPISKLICLENTHNRCGGTYQTGEYTNKVASFAHERNIFVHLDGARIFNAAVAQGIDVREITRPVDSVTFCLSKGLCAPVGSVLCGTKEFIKRAHRLRKMVGGGMRQAGIIAAAGIVALETMIDRLGEDHNRAKRLAEGLSKERELIFPLGMPATNMVFVSLHPDINLNEDKFINGLKEQGILVGITGHRSYRLVTHYWIDDAAVDKVLEGFHEALKHE